MCKLNYEVPLSHELIVITGKRGNAELLAVDDLHAINEIQYLRSAQGIRGFIIEGMHKILKRP